MIVSRVHKLGDLEHINAAMRMLPQHLSQTMSRYYAFITVEPVQIHFARHCALFEAMLDAHIRNDLSRAAETENAMRKNVDEISKALEDMNPAFTSIPVKQMMNVQIDFSKKLITTRIAENYKENLELLEQAERHAAECAQNISAVILDG